MALFTFGKTPKHRTFDYQPQHYDERKEKLALRLQEYSDDSKENSEIAKTRIRSGFQRGGRIDSGYRRNAIKKSNFRVVLIIIVLSVIGFLFLNNLVPLIVSFTD